MVLVAFLFLVSAPNSVLSSKKAGELKSEVLIGCQIFSLLA